MYRLRPILLIPVFFLASSTPSQQPDAPTKSACQPEAEVRLLDGSNVRAQILQDKLEIITKYGHLIVPTRDILKLECGLHVPLAVQKAAARAIEDLNSESYKIRELALKNLVDMGPQAYPQIVQAVKSDQPEVAKRAAMALEKIRARHPAANLRLREDDIITTPTFTIVGKVHPPVMRVKNQSFGEVELKLAQVRALRWLAAVVVDAEIVVDAGRFGSAPNQWMETEFLAASGIRLAISASGTVELWPQAGGYPSTPSGFNNVNGPSPAGTQFRAGSLVGRIGQDGPVFMIGEYFDGTPIRDGKLYLHIVPSPWNNPSVGAYQVKIKTRDDFGDDR